MAHELKSRRIRTETSFFSLSTGDFVEAHGYRYAAMRVGGIFRAEPVHRSGRHDNDFTIDFQFHGEIFRPLAPGTTFDDIDGAKHAVDKDGYWHFSHASAAEHHEFADYCEFQGLMAVQNILNTKTAEFMSNTGPLAEEAKADFLAWRDFSVRIQHHARAFALKEVLGHFERNKHLHHARTIVGRAMSAALNDMNGYDNGTPEKRYYQLIRTIALKMALSRQAPPKEAIKTWPEHRAEVAAAAAAKKKAEEASDDSDDGDDTE